MCSCYSRAPAVGIKLVRPSSVLSEVPLPGLVQPDEAEEEGCTLQLGQADVLQEQSLQVRDAWLLKSAGRW